MLYPLESRRFDTWLLSDIRYCLSLIRNFAGNGFFEIDGLSEVTLHVATVIKHVRLVTY